MRAIFQLIVLGALAWSWYAGVLEEGVNSQRYQNDRTKTFGPLTMTHVGICTDGGRKKGEIRPPIRIIVRIRATLLVDGANAATGLNRTPFWGHELPKSAGGVGLKRAATRRQKFSARSGRPAPHLWQGHRQAPRHSSRRTSRNAIDFKPRLLERAIEHAHVKARVEGKID